MTAAATLVGLMAAGSILMWIGVPLGLLWVASHLQDGSQPSMGPYLLILVGLPASMVIIAKVLATLDRAFSRVTGWDPNDRPRHAPWHESLSGERGSQRRRTVLDVVMIVSVVVAGSAFAVWFLLFAHPGMPQA